MITECSKCDIYMLGLDCNCSKMKKIGYIENGISKITSKSYKDTRDFMAFATYHNIKVDKCWEVEL